MQVKVAISGDWIDALYGPLDLSLIWIKKAKKQQQVWKDSSRLGFGIMKIDAKNIVRLWTLIELILLLAVFVYSHFIRAVFFVKRLLLG